MARKVRKFDFERRGQPKYPWDQWTDGSTWEVVQGEDFDCQPGSLVVYLYHKANQIGKRVRTQVVKGKHTKVVFQFMNKDRVEKRDKHGSR